MALEDVLTERKLRELYKEDLLTDSEIADKYKDEVDEKVYQIKISRLRDKYDIETMTKGERLEKDLPDLTDKQDQLIIGGLLGDSWISTSSKKSARFGLHHAKKQEDYLRWKASILKPYISDKGVFEGEKVTESKTYESVSAYTYSCPAFKSYYNLFYPEPDREKVFPESLSSIMTPFSLAVWYMDDGSLEADYHPVIHFGLDKTSLIRCCEALRELGLSPEIRDCKDGTKGITFPSQSYEFFNLVEDYIPPCMEYKTMDSSERRQQDRKARKLDSQTAKELHNGGMSYQEIADCYDVSRSTVGRRVRDARSDEGKSSQMGRPKEKNYSLVASKVKLESIETEDWSEKIPCKKREILDQAVSILQKTPFPFPHKIKHEQLTQDEKEREFEKLKNKDLSLNDDNEIRPDSLYGLPLCRPYFPNRFKARYKDRDSAFESWRDRDKLERAVKYQLRFGDPVTPRRVRRALQMNVRTPTLFKPVQAKFICEEYGREEGLYWDPCAGYGGRLLGSVSTGMNYIATEVDPKTVEGDRKLAKDLGIEDKVEIYRESAEEFNPSVPLDLVFTSPPYWNCEKYSNHDDQSYKKYSTFNHWSEGFLKPVIQTSYDSLKSGGYLALNISDINEESERKSTIPLEAVTKEISREVGFTFHKRVKMPIRSSEKSWEPIYIFQK